MEDDVEGGAAVLVHEAFDGGAASGGGDVLGEGVGAADGADVVKVDGDDKGADGGALDGDLGPAAGGGAEVEDGAGGAEEAELGVELGELKRRAGAVARLPGKTVVLVLPLLALHLLPHLCERLQSQVRGWAGRRRSEADVGCSGAERGRGRRSLAAELDAQPIGWRRRTAGRQKIGRAHV